MDKIHRPGARRRGIILGVARYRTVRGSIFLWVSILLVCVLLAFSLVVYDYASTVARERFADALTSLSKSVMANLDAQVAEMNRLSLTLIYSQVFRSLYSRHLALPRSPETVQREDRQAREYGGPDRDRRHHPRPQPVGPAGERLRPEGRDDRGRVLQPPHRAGREARALVLRGHGEERRSGDPPSARGPAAGGDLGRREGQAVPVPAALVPGSPAVDPRASSRSSNTATRCSPSWTC